MEYAVLEYFQIILKNNNFLVLNTKEHVLILLTPDETSSEGWISVRQIERQFEKYGLRRFGVKKVIADLMNEGQIEKRPMNDQGADYAYYRLIKKA